jgi:hypothetical protein
MRGNQTGIPTNPRALLIKWRRIRRWSWRSVKPLKGPEKVRKNRSRPPQTLYLPQKPPRTPWKTGEPLNKF